MRIKTFALGVPLCLAVLSCGCGQPVGTGHKGPDQLPTVPAGGTLTYKSAPVPNASVVFQAMDGTVSATGSTNNDGTFQLSTYGTHDGAPVGKYKVTVAVSGVKEVEPGVLAPDPGASPIPKKYASPETSDIVLEIKASDKNEFAIELK